MTSADATGGAERHVSIDAVRGFAVLGILLMNIVGMGMPTFAYVDPTYYGDLTGAKFDIVDAKTMDEAEAFATTADLVIAAIND